MGYQETRENTTVTIANGANLSSAVDLTGLWLLAIQVPAAWTTAAITLQASAGGIVYANVYDESIELSLPAAASRYLIVPPYLSHCFRHLKIRSGTVGTPVNQDAERILVLVTRPME